MNWLLLGGPLAAYGIWLFAKNEILYRKQRKQEIADIRERFGGQK